MPIVTSKGLGGGGQLFCPRISPHDPNLVFVACDMSGLYLGDNMFLSWDQRWQRNWTMLDQRVVRGSIRCSVAFDPNVVNCAMGFNPTEGLMESFDDGVTWKKYSPALPTHYPVEQADEGNPRRLEITAVGFPRDGGTLPSSVDNVEPSPVLLGRTITSDTFRNASATPKSLGSVLAVTC